MLITFLTIDLKYQIALNSLKFTEISSVREMEF